MNITALEGEKTVKALAKRLLASPGKTTPKTTQQEMEAALVRLNPQLDQVGKLPKGTPIVVPDNFTLAPDESTMPLRALSAHLLSQAETALSDILGHIKERTDQFTAQATQVQDWLKSQQAKDLTKDSPELKQVFTEAANAAKAFPKEQAAVVAVQEKVLAKVQTGINKFRQSATLSR